MDYSSQYRRKVITIETALDLIESNDEVLTSLGAVEPVTLFNHLHLLKGKVKNVSIVNALMIGHYPFYMDPDIKDSVLLNCWFLTWGPRQGHPLGTVNYVPMELHTFLQNRIHHRRPNIFWGSASSMDKHGMMTTSVSSVFEREAIEKADLVIIEVNPRLPRVYGETHVHISEVDYIVEADNEVPALQPEPSNPKADLIGRYAAELVEDGSTIQVGFGGITGAIARHLSDKKDLGVHSEVISDAILDLYEVGAITNRKKTIFKGKFVGDIGLGTRRLYDFLDDNPAVEFLSGKVMNDPAVIRQNYKMVSINSALQMDLTGQCSAETAGLRLFSGTGGHKEFVKGAQESPGGKSIIAFYSSAKEDSISRIVPQFEAGTAVTTSRVDVDYVVTEYGAVCLRGRSIPERVRALISIAHPNFRDYLKSEARRLNLW
ncbi:MAG: acetyl-CoA hydrolase/transferase family protein [Syntrophomonadaceae bacterium]|nr:acetyl-CoA hydrolase/transferase family protein [Syntrophomonadaceae bacterium]